MSFRPIVKVEAYPPDDPTGTPVTIYPQSGRVRRSMFEAGREFEFSAPEDWQFIPDDYVGAPNQPLMRGTWVRVTSCEDGNWQNPGSTSIEFWGRLRSYRTERREGIVHLVYTCLDRLTNMRSVGVRMSRSTRMMIYSDTFTAADFVPGSDYDVNLPDNGEEYVPQGLIQLVSYKNVYGGAGNNDADVYEYPPDEFVYDADNKLVGFTWDQAAYKAAGRIWEFRLFYYDPTDDANTVKAILTELLTGTPWSKEGGAGWSPGDLNLAEIVGFDGVTARRIRTIIAEKTDGPLLDMLDAMRDEGVLPRNYNIDYEPNTDQVVGEYIEQNNGAAVTLLDEVDDVLSEDEPYTLEGIAGRVEVHSEAATMINYALGKTVTVNPPVVPAGEPGAGNPYTQIGLAANITDGQAGTDIQFQHDVTYLDYPVTKTPDNCLVIDLTKDEWIDRIQVFGTHTHEGAGSDMIPNYHITRLPKMTVSASRDRIYLHATTVAGGIGGGGTIFNVVSIGTPPNQMQIGDRIIVDSGGTQQATVITNIVGVTLTVDTAIAGLMVGDPVTYDNPGIPVSPKAIAVEYNPDPQQMVHRSSPIIDVETSTIKEMRYIAIRWEQDHFYRRDGNNIGKTARQSWFGLREIKALGDGKFYYPDGDPDEGDVPYAQITAIADVVANFTNGAAGFADITFTTSTAWLSVGDTFQVRDQNGINDPITYTATNIVGLVVDVAEAIAPGDIVIGDDIGWRKRWMLNLAGNYVDLYYPDLHAKIYQTTDWLEIVDDDRPDVFAEAEALAVDRLLELIFISEEHQTVIPLDHDIDIGTTVRRTAASTPWLVTEVEVDFNAIEPFQLEVPVTKRLRGKNYEETPQ